MVTRRLLEHHEPTVPFDAPRRRRQLAQKTKPPGIPQRVDRPDAGVESIAEEREDQRQDESEEDCDCAVADCFGSDLDRLIRVADDLRRRGLESKLRRKLALLPDKHPIRWTARGAARLEP